MFKAQKMSERLLLMRILTRWRLESEGGQGATLVTRPVMTRVT